VLAQDARASDLDGQLAGDAQALSGQVTLSAADGGTVLVKANVTFSSDAEPGKVDVALTGPYGPLVRAVAEIVGEAGRPADRLFEAAAVSLLVAGLAGIGVDPDHPVALGAPAVRGDPRPLEDLAGKIVAWWDGLAGLSYAAYRSPTALVTAGAGELQLLIHGVRESGAQLASATRLQFGPDPSQVTAGSVRLHESTSFSDYVIASGSLTSGPAPISNRFGLQLESEFGDHFEALIFFTRLADGTWDVRGATTLWDGICKGCTVEGVAGPDFVLPPQVGF